MTQDSDKVNLQGLIEALASDFVVSGAASKEDVERFVEDIKKIRLLALEEPHPNIVAIADDILAALAGLAQEEAALDVPRKVLSFAISCFEEILSVAEESQPSVLARMRHELAALAGRALQAHEALSHIRLDDVPSFIANAASGAAEIEKHLMDLAQNPNDLSKLHELFCLFHTIKDEAVLVGLVSAAALAAEVGNFLEKVKSNASSDCVHDVVGVATLAVETLKEILKLLETTDVPKAVAFNISAVSDKVASFFAVPPQEACVSVPPERAETEAFAPSVPKLDLSEGTELLSEFITESREHLASAEEALLSLERSPGNADEINRIFREFHTIKGLASFLNLDDLRILTHETETMMDGIRRGTLALTQEVSGVIFSAIDASRKLFDLLSEQVSNGGVLKSPYHDISPVVAAVRGILRRMETPEGPGVEPEKPKLGEILVKQQIITEDELGAALELKEKFKDERKIGEILVETGIATPSQVERGLSEQKRSLLEETVRISIHKLGDLIDSAGELVIASSQVAQNQEILSSGNLKLAEDVAQLQRIIRNIQESVMSMRLVSIQPLFQKMRRLSRDLSKKLSKEVEVYLHGEETEIDKNIIDLLADPLVHMVRNAIDHGIEPAHVRLACGKPPVGRVELSASHKGGNIFIEIADDGAGIDKDKILQKARERGIIKEGESWSEKDIMNLIFEAGFSTVEKVTDVSGRGVGMDVVKKNISQLRGRIDVVSERGFGTTITLRLPLTLAIIDGFILAVGEERYIVPIFAVTEFIHPKQENISTIKERGEMIKIHGKLYELVRLDAHLSVRYKSRDVENLIGCLVESDVGSACILFDEIIAQQQVVIKSLGERLKDIRGLAGATILGDGRVGLILDINGILEMSYGK